MSFQLPNAEAYIFDFNGTLYFDDRENKEAWYTIFKKERGIGLSDDEYAFLNGRTSQDTVRYMKPGVDDSELERILIAKETLYKKLCFDHALTLSPGAERVLSELKMKGKRMAIASSAPKINMEWYVPEYGLLRFFSPDAIVAGCTDIPSKPDPAVFLRAMDRIGAKAEETVIFEDSASGVKAALASGAKLVIRIKAPNAQSIEDPKVIEIPTFEFIEGI